VARFGGPALPDLIDKDRAMAELIEEMEWGALFHHHMRGDRVLVRMQSWLRRP